jgi:hypothetical protein
MTAIATDAGVRLAVGLPRHGKTHGARREVFAFVRSHPCIVIDRTYEWRRPPGSLVPAEIQGVTKRASTVAQAAARIDAGARLVVISTSENVEEMAEQACRWARFYAGRAGVMISEAHHAWPVHKPLGPFAMDCVTAWRHFDVAMWVDTQRLALLNRTFDLSQTIRVYSAPDEDADRLRRIGGADLVRAVRECGLRNAPREFGGRGEPGWHVLLREGVRPKRYEPTRGEP